MGSIPPFIQQIIGVLVRIIVVWLAGYLQAKAGVTLSEDQIGQIVTYLVPVVLVLGWSLYQKHRGRVKLLVAAASPHVLTEHEVEAIVNDPAKPNPSVNTPKDALPS
jgi:hypothetical protein